MNIIYRSIWNDKAGTFVAVSENARSAGKKTSSCATATRGGARFTLKALAISLMMAFGATVYAQPGGGVVTAGSASISSGAGSMTITQSTQNTAINWQSFNIGLGEAVQFVQPNSSSVALNRVVGADPSSILGSLSANGRVFLVNPNGILFGKGASVNVGGLVASTLNVTDSDFMAGNYKFSGAGNGAVLNQGAISADGGYVALLGANVSNEGTISAKLGTVVLAAGNAVTLDVAGDGLLNVTVNQGAVNALVANGGLIRADGGQVLLTAQAAGNLLQSVVNNTGIIEAQSIENHNGMIALLGDMQSGTVNVSGTLDVSGKAAGQTGGSVSITGQHVGLFGAEIDASGDAGGGTVLVGGGLHGADSALQNASATYMSADSTIIADANAHGGGGKVVLWANDSTRAYGSISARGGAEGGDGGVIETSGHWLDVAGVNVNASARNGKSGKSGTWFLDPADLTITTNTANGTFSGASPDVFSPNPGVSSSNVDRATIIADLNAGTSVNITTANVGGGGSGDIFVTAAITWVAPVITPANLTLNAARDVNVNAAITATNGSFVSTAGGDVNVNAAVKTTVGSFTANAGNNVNVNAAITTVNGGFTANAGNNVTVGAAITTTTGDIVLRSDNDGTGPGVAGGTVVFVAPGTVTLNTGTASIYYNPASYNAPTDYTVDFTGNGAVHSYMWVFAHGDNKVYDGLTTAALSFVGDPTGGGVNAVSLTPGTANFSNANVGIGKTITYSGYSLGGANANKFALFSNNGTTTANITTAPLTVTATNASKTYGQAPTLSAFTTAGLVNGETVGSVTETSPGAPATAGVAGSPYAITPSAATGGTFTSSNYAIVYVNGVLTVIPAALTVTASDASKAYGQASTLSAFTTAGLVNGDTVGSVSETSSGTAAAASVAGSPYAITPSSATGGSFAPANYTIAYVNGALTVSPAALTVTASNASKTYGQAPTLSAFTTAGLVNGDTVGSVTETSPGTAATAGVAGSPYAITPSSATGGSFTPANYTIAYVNGTLTVIPVALTVTASNTSKPYGQTPTLTAFTTAGLVNGDTVGSVTETSPGTAATASVAGSPYVITPSNATGGTFVPSNYTIAYVNGVLTVVPVVLTVTASNASKVYGQPLTLTAFTAAGLVNGDTVASVTETSPGTLVTAGVAGSPYAITPSNAAGTFTPSNYTIAYVNGALTVIQVPLTVTASDTSKTYGQTPTLTAFTVVGLVNGESVGSVTETSPGTVASAGAGGSPYAITPSDATGGSFTPANYTIGYVNGALTVVPLAQVQTAPAFASAETTVSQPTATLSGDTTNSTAPLQYYGGSVSGGLQGLNLAVLGTGVRMPPIQLAENSPEPVPVVVPVAEPVAAPAEAPPAIFVPPPVRARKQDRN